MEKKMKATIFVDEGRTDCENCPFGYPFDCGDFIDIDCGRYNMNTLRIITEKTEEE